MSQSQPTKRKYPKRSWTWKYFLLGQDQKMKCTLCGAKVLYNRTKSSMISHLKHIHKITQHETLESRGPNGIVTESECLWILE